MGKDRIAVCEFYVAFGVCKKGRKAEHSKYCQKCDLYVPRCKEKHVNKKKQKIEKEKVKEAYKGE